MYPSLRAVMMSSPEFFGSNSFVSQFPYSDDDTVPMSLNMICRSLGPIFQSLRSPTHLRLEQEEVIRINVFADSLLPGPLIDSS